MRRFVCVLLAVLLLLPVQPLAEGELVLVEWLGEPELEWIELMPQEEPEAAIEIVFEEPEEIVIELSAEPEPEPAPAREAEPEDEEPAEEEIPAEAAILYTDLVLEQTYAMAGQQGMSWQVEAWNGQAPFAIRTWVTLEGEVVYAAEDDLEEDGAASFAYLPEHFGEHAVHAVVRDAAGAEAEVEARLPVSVGEYETEFTWEKTVRDVELTGNWAQDLIAVAASQLGYMESERNFIVDKNGVQHGFTRYGAWYGAAYSNWCAMFLSFCLYYAGVPSEYVPYDAGCASWIERFEAMGVYHEKDYLPRPGDIVFLTFEDNSHVGVVTDVREDRFSTIEGNVGRAVVRHDYHLSDAEVDGFASMREMMLRAGLAVDDGEDLAQDAPQLILRQPEDAEVAVLGDEVIFSAQVADAACRWQVSDGGEWMDVIDSNTWHGAQTDTLRFVSSAARAGYAYRLVAESEAGTAVSDTVSFRAREQVIARDLTFDRQPQDAVIASLGDEVIFTARAEGASYQWQYNSGSGWKNLTESATWHGVRTDTLRFVSSAPRMDCQYRVVATGDEGVSVSKRVSFAVEEK